MRLPTFAAFALAVTAPVAAQQPTAPAAPVARPQPFATMVAEPAAMLIAACDTNFDGIITRDEMHTCLLRTFISVSEGKATIGYIGYGDWARRWLGDANALPNPYSVDADNDDRITALELQTEFDKYFTRYDVDKNGTLTRAELLTIRTGPPSAPPGKGGRKKGR